jgi:ribonuclease R
MILANIASARFVEKNHEPALFRDHDRPSEENIKSFRSVLNELGLTLGGGNKPHPLDYAELLTQISSRPDAEMLQTMLLRSMKQAVYDPENRGHFGLALASYAHFTSPIRRYPDLLLHRAIKYLLAKENNTLQGNTTPTGGYHYEMQQMLQFGQHCSMTERRADEATRDVADWLKCDFMQDQVGETFTGVISSVTGFGFFVRLNDLFIDGLVHVSTLDNDYYRFDAIGQRLVGESGGKSYRLGDTVEVRVDAVHMDERKIDFALISSARKPRGEGKTERDRAKKPAAQHSGKRRRDQGKKVNFEPDSAFRNGKSKAGAADGAKSEKKPRKPSDKSRKIAAATRSKRAAKKTDTPAS